MDGCTVSPDKHKISDHPPPSSGRAISRRETRWLASLQLWAAAVLRHLSVKEADIGAAVLSVFDRVKQQWAAFEPPVDVPACTARRRWIASALLHLAAEHRRATGGAQPAKQTASPAPMSVIALEPREILSVAGLLRRFKRGSAVARWRVWLAWEVDGATIPEIALQEGLGRQTVRRLLERAQRDIAMDLAAGVL